MTAKPGAKKKMHHKPPAGYAMRHLKRPWHKDYIKAYQDNVQNQAQFLAAQRAMQDEISRIREASMRGNPYIG